MTTKHQNRVASVKTTRGSFDPVLYDGYERIVQRTPVHTQYTADTQFAGERLYCQ